MTTPRTRDGFDLAETRRTLPIALLRAREAVMNRFRPLLADHDITEQQWRVMRVLQEAGESDATQLSQSANVLAPSLTRMLRALEARGFTVARKDPADARRALITLTEAGLAFIRALSPESAAIYAGIEARLGRDRIEHLLDELDFLLLSLAPQK
jgi:homoprotocatechuate degradation regulator HpaR